MKEIPPKKRLVPTHIFIVQKAKRTASYTAGGAVVIMSAIALIASGCCVVLSLVLWLLSRNPELLAISVFFVIIGSVSMYFGYMGADMMTIAENMEDIELFTQDKVNQLPAEETLVRASEEPNADQDKVLLRAATEGEDTLSEQLLRPGNTPD